MFPHHRDEGQRWADLISHAPSYEEIQQVISRWATGVTRFAGMPQSTDPDYETRMREAYTSTHVNITAIANNPASINAGMRIAHRVPVGTSQRIRWTGPGGRRGTQPRQRTQTHPSWVARDCRGTIPAAATP